MTLARSGMLAAEIGMNRIIIRLTILCRAAYGVCGCWNLSKVRGWCGDRSAYEQESAFSVTVTAYHPYATLMASIDRFFVPAVSTWTGPAPQRRRSSTSQNIVIAAFHVDARHESSNPMAIFGLQSRSLTRLSLIHI